MNAASAFRVVRYLVSDTFRQSIASGIFWFMLGVSICTVLLCLSVTFNGNAEPANLEMAFGGIRVSAEQGVSEAVRTVEVNLASWVADAAGLLLALLWTASFLPSFLEPASVSVLLAKPVPRQLLLTGKFLGVLAFVGFQAFLFISGTWLALGVRTGVWDPTYFLCVPVLLLHFAVFFSFSTMLAVMTQSTVACVFGSVLFWLLCWAMNIGRHATTLLPELQGASPALTSMVEFGYWVLPKPLDFHLLLFNGLQSDHLVAGFVNTSKLAEHGGWLPVASVMASLATGLVLLAMAAYDFVTADY
jgi:ABC-type transport system involved in multi-copper enzyme maturation permease subunit